MEDMEGKEKIRFNYGCKCWKPIPLVDGICGKFDQGKGKM
jgi:hypothetical protein